MAKPIFHADSLRLNGFNADYEDEYDDGLPELPEEELDELSEEIAAFLGVFDDEDLKAAFGDHVKVTIRRDGTVDTDEYSHD